MKTSLSFKNTCLLIIVVGATLLLGLSITGIILGNSDIHNVFWRYITIICCCLSLLNIAVYKYAELRNLKKQQENPDLSPDNNINSSNNNLT